jgi:hypothetical protein
MSTPREEADVPIYEPADDPASYEGKPEQDGPQEDYEDA